MQEEIVSNQPHVTGSISRNHVAANYSGIRSMLERMGQVFPMHHGGREDRRFGGEMLSHDEVVVLGG